MNGARSLVQTLLDAGIDTCFANPGTSEMHYVAALDQVLREPLEGGSGGYPSAWWRKGQILQGLGRKAEARRTAQEALTNVSKHAHASKVDIELSDKESVLTLEVADNGHGMPPCMQDKPQAFGLKGLQERARTVGGWLDVSSKPGHGTSVILSVPLAPPPRHPAPGDAQ